MLILGKAGILTRPLFELVAVDSRDQKSKFWDYKHRVHFSLDICQLYDLTEVDRHFWSSVSPHEMRLMVTTVPWTRCEDWQMKKTQNSAQSTHRDKCSPVEGMWQSWWSWLPALAPGFESWVWRLHSSIHNKCCVGYFSIVVTKHQDRVNLQNEEFTWARGSRGVESIMVEQDIVTRTANWGLLPQTKRTRKQRELPRNGKSF